MNLVGSDSQESMQAENRAMRAILAAIVKELQRPGHVRKKALARIIPVELREKEK